MRLTSAGAARPVTGSCHLLEVGDRRVLVDCGLFQGPGSGSLDREGFPFPVASIDAVLVTHGHLDHVGRGRDAVVVERNRPREIARAT